MAREPKIDVVDLIRANFTNPNSTLQATGHKGVNPDDPRIDLTYNSYPRISVVDLDSKAEYLGIGSETRKVTWTGQIGIWVKQVTSNDQILTVGGTPYAEEKLVDYIKNEINKILETNWKTISNDYLDYKKLSEGKIEFDLDRNTFVKIITIELDYIENSS